MGRCSDCGILCHPDLLTLALDAGGHCPACAAWRIRHGPPEARGWSEGGRWTKAEREQLRQELDAGVRPAEIARRLDKTGKAVNRALKRARRAG